MTTFSLQGLYIDELNGEFVSYGRVELDLVLARASSTWRYTVIDPGDGIPEVDFVSQILDGSIATSDGQFSPFTTLPEDVITSVGRISWSGKVTTLISFEVSTGPESYRAFYFRLDGAELPAFSNLDALVAFNDSLSPLGAGTGGFAPGRPILWNSIAGVATSEDDEFFGSAGADTMNGGKGDDYFVSTAGKDRYIGGTGIDQITFQDDPSGVVANLTTGRAVDGWGNAERLSSIEMLRGSAHDDRFTGCARDNVLRGLAGDDVLDGKGGVDTVRYDRDARYGGTAGVTVDLGRKIAIDGFGDTDRLTSIECVLGSDNGDRITGSGGKNTLEGGAGNDTLRGLGGKDRLSGGNGNDAIDGGRGNDILTGGAGADRFVFSGNFGRDRISDFLQGGDTIDLRGVASITSFRDLTRNHLSTSGEDLRIDAGGGNTITLLDVDRSDLSASDFLF